MKPPSTGLLAPQFRNEDAARKHLERLRWPDGPECPHCGLVNEATRLEPRAGSKQPARKGLWNCRGCRKQFTVTIDSIFEDSHIPLHKWLLAIHLMGSSKKGVSALQLKRNLELGSYQTAWFMAHRIRWALAQTPFKAPLKGTIEIDETYIGGKVYGKGVKAARDNKAPVVSLVERGGNARSFAVNRVTLENLKPIVKAHVHGWSHVMTDDAVVYPFLFKNRIASHDIIRHNENEYSRKENGKTITTNTVEGYFSLVKRGYIGIYHHWSRKHMAQYLREFDWRYNVRKLNDADRAEIALRMTAGKRLMFKPPQTKVQNPD